MPIYALEEMIGLLTRAQGEVRTLISARLSRLHGSKRGLRCYILHKATLAMAGDAASTTGKAHYANVNSPDL